MLGTPSSNEWFEDISKDKILAYLEKQKEQKPNIELIQKSWYLEGYHDGKYNIEPKWLIQTCEGGPRYEENPKYGTQKPAEWSEEDDAKWYGVIETEEYMLRVVRGEQRFDVGNKEIERQCKEELDWLKSLRPKPHWKPSEEQMKALKLAYEDAFEVPESCVPHLPLKSLYEQLKSL